MRKPRPTDAEIAWYSRSEIRTDCRNHGCGNAGCRDLPRVEKIVAFTMCDDPVGVLTAGPDSSQCFRRVVEEVPVLCRHGAGTTVERHVDDRIVDPVVDVDVIG